MWGLVPPQVRVGAVLVCALALAAIQWVIAGMPNRDVVEWAWHLLSSVGVITVLGSLLGRYRSAWLLLASKGLGRWFYPDLNGTWRGTVKSSFTERTGQPDTEIQFIIDQRWGGISMDGRSLSGYHKSASLHVTPALEDRDPVLWVHFKGIQDAPKRTDEGHFFGSARLVYDRDTERLQGPYWTNRAHQITGSGGTAGTMMLERISG